MPKRFRRSCIVKAPSEMERGQTDLGYGAHPLPTALPVTGEVTDRARMLLDEHSQLMAREAVHAAVVEI
jgi:hypothetical protein